MGSSVAALRQSRPSRQQAEGALSCRCRGADAWGWYCRVVYAWGWMAWPRGNWPRYCWNWTGRAVLSLSSRQRYFLYRQATDMRKGFNGLNGLVRQHLGQDPLSGDVFLFLNRRRDRIKLLMWDKTGFALYCKQLESGSFELPAGPEGQAVELSWSELAMLLDGYELSSVKRRKRYQKAG